jgi:Flp pilus assembly protein TadB
VNQIIYLLIIAVCVGLLFSPLNVAVFVCSSVCVYIWYLTWRRTRREGRS